MKNRDTREDPVRTEKDLLFLVFFVQVYTFGCNDEGALGRTTEDDDECYTPGKVDLGGKKIVQISAGDSHTVALAEDGKAYFWGNFRDSSGPFGLTMNGAEKLPVPLAHDQDLIKIASGKETQGFSHAKLVISNLMITF